MKQVLYFVFLTLTLVQGHQVVHRRGSTHSNTKEVPKVTESSTDTALLNLMLKTVPIPFNDKHLFRLISHACKSDMSQQCKQKTKTALHCDFSQKTCYVTGTPLVFQVYVFSKTKYADYEEKADLAPGSEEFANQQKYQAVFLPFVEHGDTYTILDPFRAPWFFTAELGGCDIFVATVENQGNKPLVVHSNRNEEKVDIVKNLKLKEESVDALIQSLNPDYKVIARVHFTSTNKEEKKKIDQHLSEYAATPRHKGIVFIPYDNGIEPLDGGGFHFFGNYNGGWTFVLKGISSGKIFYTLSVSAKGDIVNVY